LRASSNFFSPSRLCPICALAFAATIGVVEALSARARSSACREAGVDLTNALAMIL
jgi:hypothetical protein